MKNIFILFLLTLFACKQASEKTSLSNSTSTDPSIEKSMQDAGSKDLELNEFMEAFGKESKETARLIDLRTPPEFNDGFIKGAVMINFLDDDIDKQLSMLDKSKKYFIYCQQGGRSQRCMDKMKVMGFQSVYNLLGGYTGYLAANPK